MTKIDLITGILGAGKTTFLRRYAQHFIDKGQHIAILVNDYGAVNVDMLLLKDLSGDHCQLEMVAACNDPYCHRRRFKTQLVSLGMQHFDRVLIEPSGIFDMDEFFDTLHDTPLDRWFEIGSVLTIVDASCADTLPPQLEYLFASEAACAGKLILSKLSRVSETPEQASARALAHLSRALTAVQCDRQFTRSDLLAKEWDTLTAEDFDALSQAGYRAASYVKQFQPETYDSAVHYFMHIRIPQARTAERLSSGRGRQLASHQRHTRKAGNRTRLRCAGCADCNRKRTLLRGDRPAASCREHRPCVHVNLTAGSCVLPKKHPSRSAILTICTAKGQISAEICGKCKKM